MDPSLRTFKEDTRDGVVRNHYRKMRESQTMEYVARMKNTFSNGVGIKMTIREAFSSLREFTDASDPDVELPNIVHAFQTAEAIRKKEHPEWLQLTGLIHDLGKVIFLHGTEEDGQSGRSDGPQWGIAGDTWIVGCKIPNEVPYPEFNKLNPDMKDPRYNSDMGMYSIGCGLDSLTCAYGHDEYLYHVLKRSSTLPQASLDIVRYHSCYPLHQEGFYDKFLVPSDLTRLEWVKLFNTFDLYTKTNAVPNMEQLWPYYERLIDKYIPGKILW